MFTKTGLALVLGMAIVCYTTDLVASSPQQVTFYQGADCTGESDTISDVVDNLIEHRMGNATSVKILGLWKLVVYQDLGNGRLEGFSIIHYNTNPPDGRCANKADMSDEMEDPDNYAFYFADRLGAKDMATSQIIFYTEQTFKGLRYAVNQNNTAQVGPRPFVMSSYIHFSNDTWSVYPEPDFKGVPTILSPTFQNEDGYSYNSDLTLIVGSVRKGRDETAPTTTDTSATDKNSTGDAATVKTSILSIILIAVSVLI